MDIRYLNDYKKRNANLSDFEKRLRDVHLRNLLIGEEYGPILGYPSVSKVWLKYYSEESITKDVPRLSMYQYALLSNYRNMDGVAIDLRSSKNHFKKGIRKTYRQFFGEIDNCVKGLLNMQVHPNEIIPIILPNIPEARYLIYANSYIGSITYPISPMLPESNFEKILSENEIRTIFIFEGFLEKYREIIKKCEIENVVLLDGTETLPSFMKKRKLSHYCDDKDIRIITWDEFCENGKWEEMPTPYYEDNHVAVICGTSGTTGTSKGVCLTDDNLNYAAAGLYHGHCFEGDNVMDALIPSIGYGITMLHYQTISQKHVYLIPELLTTKFPEAYQTVKPANFPGGPVHSINLLGNLKREDYSFGGTLTSGGATLPKQVEEEINMSCVGYKEPIEGSPNVIVRQGYALTENAALGTYAKKGSYTFGSVGIPVLYENMGIFKPDSDEELGFYEVGEVCISGSAMMKEYLNNPEETQKVIKTHSDGTDWIHTKDIGYMDSDGNLFHVDRIKNIFMRCGFNIHPTQIAEFLDTIPFVKNSVVIGFDHPDEQTVPVAFIELDRSRIENYSDEELKKQLEALCYKNLEETSIPYEFIFMDSLPINMGGKIDTQLIKKESGIDYMSTDSVNKQVKILKI